MDQELVKELSVDRNKLDDELIRQPGLYMKYAELASEAQFEMDKAKERLDLKKAELDNKIRLRFSGADKKPTEAAISGQVITDPEYVVANKEYLEACLTYRTMCNARDAFSHKKSGLESLVRLVVAGYWGDIRQPFATARLEEKAEEKVATTLNDSPRLAETPKTGRRVL